ncbi:hypothetical protein AMECASPLE_029606 [Ameca splendens]|uniref:Uncharacterized protein n=1 Tax=Ameca splendens TaxID=208324 RepID=A0ABV1ADT0_9TELE
MRDEPLDQIQSSDNFTEEDKTERAKTRSTPPEPLEPREDFNSSLDVLLTLEEMNKSIIRYLMTAQVFNHWKNFWDRTIKFGKTAWKKAVIIPVRRPGKIHPTHQITEPQH